MFDIGYIPAPHTSRILEEAAGFVAGVPRSK